MKARTNRKEREMNRNAFDKVIGYTTIKEQLFQILDMIRNRDVYARIGAKVPCGTLLVGDPGLGKTLLATSFIEASGLPALTVRKTKGDLYFTDYLTETFEAAAEKAPCIVFLDDLDKFSNSDRAHRDAEAFVAVQAGIDEVRNKDVFVIATANDMSKLPDSLTRDGRFDRVIHVGSPSREDAEKIIAYYLSDKKIDPAVSMTDLSRMISYSSCAELSTLLNEAAVYAAYRRNETVGMQDFVNAVLRKTYQTGDVEYTFNSDDETNRLALHEAGHLVVSEVLDPGSVGFVSIRPFENGAGSSMIGGFVHRCKSATRRPHVILGLLGSKAAVELFHCDRVASGCSDDLRRATRLIMEGITQNSTAGCGLLDVSRDTSEQMNSRHEAATLVQLENYLMKARDILLKNRAFLEGVTEELKEKGYLLYSDVQRIKETVGVVPVAA